MITAQTPGSALTDAELLALLRSVNGAIFALGQRADWASRRYAIALAAEAAWRKLEV